MTSMRLEQQPHRRRGRAGLGGVLLDVLVADRGRCRRRRRRRRRRGGRRCRSPCRRRSRGRARRCGRARRRRAAEVVDRRVDVLVPAPAVGVDGALAVAAAARVVDEHAVAVALEHLRVAQRAAAVAAAARDHQHRRAVARRAVPALELDAVGGREVDGLVGGARRAARPAGAASGCRRSPCRPGMKTNDHGERPSEHGDADRPARDRARDALAAMAERDPGGEADQHDARGEREHAGHVVGRHRPR